MRCETCGIKITIKNFWKHKHKGYTQYEDEVKNGKK